MLLPLALLSAVAILSTTGSVKQDTKDVAPHKDDVFPGIGQYLYDGKFRNWTEAIKFCESNKGELAVINSEAEKNALRTIMAKNGATRVHLGFHDKYVKGIHVTIHDEPLLTSCNGVSQWAEGYPRDDDRYTCGGFTQAGYIEGDCVSSEATICEYPPTSNYDLIPEVGYYNYHPERVTWPAAWQVCAAEGAHLYVVDTVTEREAVFAKYNYSEIWVGAHRLYAPPGEVEEFTTVFNQPLPGRSLWYPGFPTGNTTTRPYVSIYKNGYNSMATNTGNTTLPCICELHSYTRGNVVVPPKHL